VDERISGGRPRGWDSRPVGRWLVVPVRGGLASRHDEALVRRPYTAAVAYTSAEEEWRALLTGTHPGAQRLRRMFRGLPSPPRCKLCYSPFAGIGGFVLRPVFGRWERNSQLCKNCMASLTKMGVGGAEVELTLLFVDIRGSTALGERLRPAEFSALLGSFYRLAAAAIIDADGIVDKFVGDEAIGLFIPGFAGPEHAAKAIAAGRAILEAAGRPDATANGPIPVGGGLQTGIAYVGTLGSSERISDFTALGDPVNTTARLASLADAGELLVSVAAAERAGLDISALERRSVEVRGREAGLDVVSLRATAVPATNEIGVDVA
jgi:adenylate cyclase